MLSLITDWKILKSDAFVKTKIFQDEQFLQLHELNFCKGTWSAVIYMLNITLNVRKIQVLHMIMKNTVLAQCII